MVGVRRPPKTHQQQGTAVKKSSQNLPVDATTPAIPEHVSVAMAEIAENMSEGLLALAVGAGLQVMQTLMESDVTASAGPRGKHDATRTAVRHGRERGSVTLGGRRVPVTRPRVRAADGSGELVIPSYELFTSTEILGRMAMEKMLAGLSTRRYPVGLEPVGQQITQTSSATSKSAVSRRFVAMTETALSELLAADLSGLDLVALMIDGVHFAQSCCIVALGIGIDGVKHPLALVEGSTENATLVTGLLVDLRERGLDVTRPMLVGIDGSKALLALAAELDRTHPGAAASLREGLSETLTMLRLGVPPTLARTLRSTNAIESMISICREHATNVKRWRNGQMALRWCAAGMIQASKQFRRVNGHLHLPALRAALDREIAEPVAHNDQVNAA